MSGDRELDVVVFGATGFAGRLVAGYLAGHAPGGVRIGLAGRSERRLAGVRAQLGAAASAWPLLVADSADPVSVAALARAARVVVTTVGPYRAHGLALVQACAEAGTDYADLTGEVLFIRDSIDRCHDVAAQAGARIVHCCGFDSVPSDLGVLGLHEAARADDAGDLQDTTLVVTALRGGVSGGTLASMMGQQAEVRASAQRRRVAGDPYALSPDRAAEPDLGDERDLDWVRYDGGLRIWTGPFAMAGINTRVVRRSTALQGWAYGRRFRYREVTGFGAGPAAPLRAAAVSAALKAASLHSEKYEIRVRDYEAPGNIVAEIAKLNRIRKTYPALQDHLGLRFYPAHNDQIVLYGKPLPARGDIILIAVTLDPFHVQEATIEVPLWEWGFPDNASVTVRDLMHDADLTWHGKLQRIRLDPADLPFAIWRVRPQAGG